MYGLLARLSFRPVASTSCCQPTLGLVHRKRSSLSTCQADISRIDAFADLSTVDLEACDRWSLDAVADTEKSRVLNRRSGICINSNFDSGNINVVSAENPDDIQLQIRADPYCETDGRSHFGWFYFRVTGAKDTPLTINIVNAGDASFPEGWEGYDACCSVDRINWSRVPSTYDKEKGVFSFSHTPLQGAVFYAYFAPYPYERHLQLISEMQMSDDVTHETLGETLDGHDLDLLIVGDEAPHKKKVWIIARQHPGETMAEWFIEGLLQRVTDRHDGVARDLLTSQATLYVVPNMNPDGSWRGHLRTDGNGINMNRTWATAKEAEVPSVYHVLRKMRETGVDLFVDVHGDEALPHNFIACAEGIPSWSEEMAALKEEFSQTLRRAHPAFQTKHGYEIDAPNTANMGIATNFVAEEFKCFTMTLEMPFKDCADLPDKEFGWSPQRCMRFGAAFLSAVRQILPRL